MILLLAEDNLPDALFVQEAIRAENLPLEVHIAADGEQAVGFMARSGVDPDAPRPHVLLLDLNLPKIDGFEALRRIRSMEQHKNIPVLVVTSSDSPDDRRKASELGVRYFFRKPVTYGEFIKIGAFLRQFLQENSLL